MTRRISARAYAALTGVHEDTVQRKCRDGLLVARRSGNARSRWQIDVEQSERLLSLKFGNAAERDLVRRKKH